MPAPTVLRRARVPRALVGALLALTACRAPVTPVASSDALPRRLVLALDGVDYRDIVRARAAGRFRAFFPPSRLVSTFPSISDVAWHEILGVAPPAGYQRVFYSHAAGSVLGGALDAITPIEFEERMDFAFGGKFHHLGAYLISDHVARGEIDDATAGFWRVRDRHTVYVYNVGPDALQHTRGQLDAYLAHLDEQLAALLERYRTQTGRPLEIVLLSDHGHNKASDAHFLPIVDTLAAHGFLIRGTLETPRDVALSVDGVTTGFGIFCDPDSADTVAALVAALPDVDVVTARQPDGRIHVRAGTARAWIERAPNAPDRHRYVAESGDPLALLPVIDRLRRDGALDADGYAPDSVWSAATLTAHYPAALERIVRGHTAITRNPAPVLVSIARSARIGFGMVSTANKLRPLGGTHGALDSTSALGVLMTTFRPTHDDVTTRVRAQLDDFADLGTRRGDAPAVRITTGARLRDDPRGAFRDAPLPNDALGAGLLLEGNDPALRATAGTIEVELRRAQRALPDFSVAGRWTISLGEGTPAANGRAHFLPFTRLPIGALERGRSYALRVVITPAEGGPGSPAALVLPVIPAHTDRRGQLVAP